MALFQPPKPSGRRFYPTPRPLPARDQPSIKTRIAHVDAALREGALSADEALLMCDLIRFYPGDLGHLDIYRRYSSDPRAPGEWVVWTVEGEKPLRWWWRVYDEVMRA